MLHQTEHRENKFKSTSKAVQDGNVPYMLLS